ncbi:phosphotransferase [Demequina muriae]|uniref:Phosphotransferase n=1 Tax=Demequina muriae TaxID=3051664 RepID=A0ABT8GFM9_9MICO|nr:phosphotransferase [Demequina sp. EGI L300058]MDN4480242.1 phosphotransferase [Demequina sp. EGI L300058]
MSARRPPEAHPAVNQATVRALVASQHPDLAHLPVGTRNEGFDMAMFRLGESLAVRLPRTADGAAALEEEAVLVPRLSGGWTFPYPRIVRRGEPDHGYPWRWNVVEWLDDALAAHVPLNEDAGVSVAEALSQVHRPAPPDARFNVEESVDLAERDTDMRASIAGLTGLRGPSGRSLDTSQARQIWASAMEAPPPHESVWSHADLHGFNVLSEAGRFAGIIDWGDIAGCDPAVDLGFLFTLMPGEGVARAWKRYASLTGRGNDALWARARGIGLWKSAGLALVDEPTVSAMGWRGLDALGVAH